MWLLSVICQWRARTEVRAFRLGESPRMRLATALAAWASAGDDVAVDVQGDGDVGAAEALADHLARDAGG